MEAVPGIFIARDRQQKFGTALRGQECKVLGVGMVVLSSRQHYPAVPEVIEDHASIAYFTVGLEQEAGITLRLRIQLQILVQRLDELREDDLGGGGINKVFSWVRGIIHRGQRIAALVV